MHSATREFDKIVIGAGIYGLYSALKCGKRGEKVLVLEKDPGAFMRATFINQARVHMGYHYPRSYSTAIKSAHYFNRFNEDFGFCILDSFDQVYATSDDFSWTDAAQFEKFCRYSKIPCEKLSTDKYFKEGTCDGAFLTKEYTYDARILKQYFLDEIEKLNNITIRFSEHISKIKKTGKAYIVTSNKEDYSTSFLLNCAYAGTNEILDLLDLPKFKIKYELCEIILCKTNDTLKNVGLTVMDGPFFSIMPFGKTGLHSLTSVTFTPHVTSYNKLPSFPCQEKSEGYCSPINLGNCNSCIAKPTSAFPYMSRLAKKYMLDSFYFEYFDSLFSMKPILQASEVDDSRPTIIRTFTTNPTFVSVLSGKINTVYDLDGVL